MRRCIVISICHIVYLSYIQGLVKYQQKGRPYITKYCLLYSNAKASLSNKLPELDKLSIALQSFQIVVSETNSHYNIAF